MSRRILPPAITVEKTFTVPSKGLGKPDYSREVSRGITVAGYVPKENETIHYFAYIALSDPVGALPFTFPGIPAGAEVSIIDVATGNNFFLTEAGYDCIVKDMWISFTEPTRWRMWSFYHSDYCCQAFFEPYSKPLNVYPFGYVKSSMVPLDQDWRMQGRVKNLGKETMFGKAWLTILKKPGYYRWR